MATQTYIKQDAGKLRVAEPNTLSTGINDEGKLVALDLTGRLDVSLMPIDTFAPVLGADDNYMTDYEKDKLIDAVTRTELADDNETIVVNAGYF